jgi:hypothetical protein
LLQAWTNKAGYRVLKLAGRLRITIGYQFIPWISRSWNAEFDEETKSIEEISVANILGNDFYFKERGFYTIKRATGIGLALWRRENKY